MKVFNKIKKTKSVLIELKKERITYTNEMFWKSFTLTTYQTPTSGMRLSIFFVVVVVCFDSILKPTQIRQFGDSEILGWLASRPFLKQQIKIKGFLHKRAYLMIFIECSFTLSCIGVTIVSTIIRLQLHSHIHQCQILTNLGNTLRNTAKLGYKNRLP